MSSLLDFIKKILEENPNISVEDLQEKLRQESIKRIKELKIK
jgi:uncharacterized membrane protein YcaP (DUF421 family)